MGLGDAGPSPDNSDNLDLQNQTSRKLRTGRAQARSALGVLGAHEIAAPVGVAKFKEVTMGRGILLWLLGIPLPIIILLALFWH